MRKLFLSLVASAGLLYAGPAAALSYWYADVQTSSMLGNVHGTVTLPTNPGSLHALIAGGDLDYLGTGLGASRVDAGNPIVTTHTFSPDVPVSSVVSACLVVSVIDDFDLESEELLISIDGSALDGDRSHFLAGFFGGSVSGWIDSAGDSVEVTIASVGRGDFRVAFSALAVNFESAGGGGPTIPEPSAALVFAAGLLVASRRRR
ncbi:MAG: hypothetical protein OZ948_13550 [Deltaproteobacteria bacterium]|nr:hypothetical protein [Deltaproteobacteria bacterium]